MSLLYLTPLCHIDNIHFIGQDHRGENTGCLIKKAGLIGIFRRIMAKKKESSTGIGCHTGCL